MSSTKLTTDNIESLDASKLSGNLPAIDGSNLTGIGDFMVSGDEPTASENPSGGVGTLWMNHSSGESYMLTNASTNSNVWTNIGASGTGDVFKPPYSYQGTQYGYVVGSTNSPSTVATSHKWSYASNNTVSAHNNLVSGGLNYASANAKAPDWSYFVGGAPYNWGTMQNIQKVSHTTGVTSQSQGTVSTRGAPYGYASYSRGSASSETHGYFFGGQQQNGWPQNNQLEKYAYAYNSGSTNWGNMQQGCSGPTGMPDASNGYGYISAGYWYSPSMVFNRIERFSYSSSGTSTMPHTISYPMTHRLGYGTTSYGFIGGGGWPSYSSYIERLSYASNGSVTQWGNLSGGRNHHHGAAASFTTEGHAGAGTDGTGITKFNFSSSGTTASWGSVSGYAYTTGQHS
jgi:hypothetical protein